MQTQDATLESGFDNTSRNVKLPMKTLPTLLPSTAQTTEASIVSCQAIVAMAANRKWRRFRMARGSK